MTASYKVVYSKLHDLYICEFHIDNRLNKDERGTDGTGLKLYHSCKQASEAGKRYLRKMEKNGFTVQS